MSSNHPYSPPRPKRWDNSIHQAAANRMAAAVKAGWSNYDKEEDGDEDDIADDLLDALSHTVDHDGYDLCRYLENRKYWYPDAELVEVIDQVGGIICAIHSDKIDEWVKTYDIRPDLKIGDIVMTKMGAGVITKIYSERAEYCIDIEEKYGYIFPYEEVTLTVLIPPEDQI